MPAYNHNMDVVKSNQLQISTAEGGLLVESTM